MGEVIRKVSEAAHNEGIMVTDVGQNQLMACRYFKFTQKRSVVTSGGLGTMGFGLPAAIGATFGAPDRTVCLFVGDGGDRKRLEKLAEGMDNVEFRGYRPLSEMPGVYAESDLFYVGQDAHAASDGIPSKIYRILGARKPLVVVAPPDGDLADTIRQMRSMDLAVMGEAGYRYVKEGFSREKITGMYAALVEELA